MSFSAKFRSNLTKGAALAAVASITALGVPGPDGEAQAAPAQSDLVSMCTVDSMSGVVSNLGMGVTVKQVPNGPQLPGGVKLVPAAGKIPAYCQVTGSYVTNPKTGKTANFLATFPERWNGKYLQLGCSGACGFLLMNDPASPPITITAQGYPGQLIEKGYATFGNDLGHVAPSPASMSFDFLKTSKGDLDVDALEDYLFRADLVMADMGKAYTRAFYSRKTGDVATIAKSYFSGCSQGGREALIAATRFPEKFDGIIAGSPASDHPGLIWSTMGRVLAAQEPGLTKLTPGQVDMLNKRIVAQCDALDGVKDGLIQNPAACEFHPARDVPICAPGQSGDTCVTKAQAANISVRLTGMTDESGQVLQPGYALGESDFSYVMPIPKEMPVDADMRFLIGKSFDGQSLVSVRTGGPGPIDAEHVVVNRAAYEKYKELVRRGTVDPEDFAKLLKQNGKLIWYHNLSDEALTPYMSINKYKSVAAAHGGYAKVQKNIRFFAIPGTGHCSMGGAGTGNFDAIGTLESWVEQGKAPQAIPARSYDYTRDNPIMGKVDWSKPAPRTMPLCTFPQMAHYKGAGEMKDASNWECRASDTRMLTVGTSGRQGGVSQ